MESASEERASRVNDLKKKNSFVGSMEQLVGGGHASMDEPHRHQCLELLVVMERQMQV